MDKIIEKEKFLNRIENRPDILRMLSIERLKMLNSYYDKDIEEKKEKIKKLRKQL